MSSRFPQCQDCSFNRVEPAICDECKDADQFEDADSDGATSAPIYFHSFEDAA